MKYMYILLCVMSSFFANKSLATEDLSIKYAFFIPNNAYQGNTDIKPITLPENSNKSNSKNKKTTPTTQPSKTNIAKQKQPEITLPYVHKTLKPAPTTATTPVAVATSTKTKSTNKKTSPIMSKKAPKKTHTTTTTTTQKLTPQNKYELDDNISQTKPVIAQIETPEEEIKEISQKEKYETYRLSDLLKEIPYPDTSLPMFKQRFHIYALELKSLYRHNSLPYNIEQDEILSKANTIRRFEVE